MRDGCAYACSRLVHCGAGCPFRVLPDPSDHRQPLPQSPPRDWRRASTTADTSNEDSRVSRDLVNPSAVACVMQRVACSDHWRRTRRCKAASAAGPNASRHAFSVTAGRIRQRLFLENTKLSVARADVWRRTAVDRQLTWVNRILGIDDGYCTGAVSLELFRHAGGRDGHRAIPRFMQA